MPCLAALWYRYYGCPAILFVRACHTYTLAGAQGGRGAVVRVPVQPPGGRVPRVRDDDSVVRHDFRVQLLQAWHTHIHPADLGGASLCSLEPCPVPCCLHVSVSSIIVFAVLRAVVYVCLVALCISVLFHQFPIVCAPSCVRCTGGIRNAVDSAIQVAIVGCTPLLQVALVLVGSVLVFLLMMTLEMVNSVLHARKVSIAKKLAGSRRAAAVGALLCANRCGPLVHRSFWVFR